MRPVTRREGEHTVRVLASNRVSSASLQKQLFVVRTPCQPPPVTSLGPRKVQVGVGAAGQAETALGAQLRERSAVQPGPRDGRGRGQGPEASGPGLRPRERGPRERPLVAPNPPHGLSPRARLSPLWEASRSCWSEELGVCRRKGGLPRAASESRDSLGHSRGELGCVSLGV